MEGASAKRRHLFWIPDRWGKGSTVRQAYEMLCVDFRASMSIL